MGERDAQSGQSPEGLFFNSNDVEGVTKQDDQASHDGVFMNDYVFRMYDVFFPKSESVSNDSRSIGELGSHGVVQMDDEGITMGVRMFKHRKQEKRATGKTGGQKRNEKNRENTAKRERKGKEKKNKAQGKET